MAAEAQKASTWWDICDGAENLLVWVVDTVTSEGDGTALVAALNLLRDCASFEVGRFPPDESIQRHYYARFAFFEAEVILL